MKKVHIVLIILIAVVMSVIITFALSKGKGKNDNLFSTYETFASAAQKQGETFVVIAKYDSAKGTQYDPKNDANRFVFYAKDKSDNLHRVIFSGTKPTDFEKSEQLVMTGHMQGEDFICNRMQMKCPSKYEDDQVAVGNGGQKG